MFRSIETRGRKPLYSDNPAMTAAARAIEGLGPMHCKWPIGDPKTESFRFCGKRRMTGRDYCREHHERAHRCL